MESVMKDKPTKPLAENPNALKANGVNPTRAPTNAPAAK